MTNNFNPEIAHINKLHLREQLIFLFIFLTPFQSTIYPSGVGASISWVYQAHEAKDWSRVAADMGRVLAGPSDNLECQPGPATTSKRSANYKKD